MRIQKEPTWDGTITLSDKKYLSSEISTTLKVETYLILKRPLSKVSITLKVDGTAKEIRFTAYEWVRKSCALRDGVNATELKFTKSIEKEIRLTAKEWIEYEIDQCKRELEYNKKELASRKQLGKDIKELKLLNKYFNKHITEIDILGILTIGNDKENNIFENFKDIKNLISEKIKRKEQELEGIKKEQTDIKKICFKNISLILKKEGLRDFSAKADSLMYINDIQFHKNYKQKIYSTNNGYTQNNVELFVKKLKK